MNPPGEYSVVRRRRKDPEVWADWQALGICRYWMAGADRCYKGDQCVWSHPPQSEIGKLWEQHGRRLQDRSAVEEEDERSYVHAPGPAPGSQPSWGGQDMFGGQETFGRYGPDRAPPPPDHPVSQPERNIYMSADLHALRQISASQDRAYQYGARQGTPAYTPGLPSASYISHMGLPLGITGQGHANNTRTAPSSGHMDRGREQSILSSFAATSIDAPPSPGPEVYSGIRQEPGNDNPNNSTAAYLSGPANVSSTNTEPLGKPNRLLQRTKKSKWDVGPPLSLSVPTSAAQTVWKRADSAETPQANEEDKMQIDEPPRHQGGYWKNMQAKKAAQQEHDRDGKGAGDVQIAISRGAQANALEAIQPRPTARDEVHITPMRPPPPARPVLSFPYASKTPPPATASKSTMGATKRLSNGDPKPPIGPHPSTILVAAPYTTQARIEKRLFPPALDHHEKSLAEAREDSNCLQGVTWLDNVRRALQLPVRTLTTACVMYHKFRMTHPGADYAWADVAAACLLAACKIEDSLKKSKDILAAAYNLKAGSHDALGADDVIFEVPSRAVIGMERLVLEAGGFDFRSVDKHRKLVKIQKSLPDSDDRHEVGRIAWTVMTDLHRTFAPLKHTSATLAIACLELAAYLHASDGGSANVIDQVKAIDIGKWSTTRENIMETLLDLLDLYTHHTTASILGTKYSLDDFLRLRLGLNKECNENNIPRYQTVPDPADRPAVNGTTLRVANGHPTPVSPPQPGADAQSQPTILPTPSVPEGGGTLRFILNPQLAADEKAEVQKFFVEEWEDYEEVIEVPLPRPKSPSRERERERPDRTLDARPAPPSSRARDPDKRSDIDDRRSLDRRSREDLRESHRDRDRDRDRERERDRVRERDREVEHERARVRDRDRDRRYDDRRYDERDRYDRRDRRYDDYDRRRDRR